MTWIQSSSGQRLDLFALRPEAVRLDDIAESLSKICRFTGSPRQPYSVAEHSCIVHDHAPRELRALALLHDAAEYVIGDISGPLKQYVYVYVPSKREFMRAHEFERGLLEVIFPALGVDCTAQGWSDVRAIDKRVLATEAPQVYQNSFDKRREEWGPMAEPLPVRLQWWSAPRAKAEFLLRANACALKGAK